LELLKLLNKQQQQADEIAYTDKAYRKATMNVLQFTFLSAMVLELVATISTAIVAVEIGLRLLNGGMDYQTALFLLILAPEFYLPLRQLGVKYHAAMTGIQAAGSIFEYLQKPPIQVSISPKRSNDLELRNSSCIFPIVFDQVSVQYPQAPQSSVEGIDLTIEEGKHYALVGPSGAGKTTLLYLLLRFLEPRSGLITACDHALSAWEPSDWLEKIAWVPQKPHLLAGSVAYNITFRENGYDESRLKESLQQAGMLEWISSLPHGWNSPVGELSSGISTGQSQRIALARAFYKDAPILLLDEPTSAVDPILEKQLQETTSALLQKRTSITIAHRLPTIYQSDEIVFLQSGRIMEKGDHVSLLNKHNYYFDFYQRYHHAG
jgi:ATP-binding cassette subfamily C protein CydD